MSTHLTVTPKVPEVIGFRQSTSDRAHTTECSPQKVLEKSMGFIHNDVTSTRWPRYLGVLMYRRLWRNSFDQSYFSQGRRYRALSNRYGYKTGQQMICIACRKIFEITLVCNSFCYFISIPVGYSSVSCFTSEI